MAMNKAQKKCCVYGFNITVFFLSLGALIALAVLLAEYFLVYEEWIGAVQGNCVTESSTYRAENGICSYSCGKHSTCSHEYPCLLIYTTYFDLDTPVKNTTNLLNNENDYLMLYQNEQAYDSRKSGCSYIPPCMEYEQSAVYVLEYQAEYGFNGQQYECFHRKKDDKDDLQAVVQEISGNTTMFIHFFLWPSVAFVLCVIYFIVMKCIYPEEGIWYILGLEWLCCRTCPDKQAKNLQSNDQKVDHHGKVLSNPHDNQQNGGGLYGDPHGNNLYGNDPFNNYGNNYGNNYSNDYGDSNQAPAPYTYDNQMYKS